MTPQASSFPWTSRRIAKFLGGGAIAAAFSITGSHAADWTLNNSGNWSGTANWAGGVIPDGVGDTANFQFDITQNRIVTIDTTPRTVGIVNIGDSNGSHNYTIAASGGASLTFNNGGGGAALNQLTGANTFSTPIILADSLSVNNGSSGLLTISGGLTSTGTSRNLTLNANSTGGVTLSTVSVNHSGMITNSGVGSGTTTISSIIGSNVTSVVQDSASSVLLLSASNAYTGGLNIKKGTVVVSSNNNTVLGTGTMLLGDTSGTNNATLIMGSNTTANTIVVVAGSTNNTLTIASNGAAAARPNGNIILNNNLSMVVDTAQSGRSSGAFLASSGAISGSGNLNLAVNAGLSTSNAGGGPQIDSLILSGVISTTGTIRNSGTGSGRAAISGQITNASGVVQDSATSMLSLSGSNSYAGATSVNAGVLRVSNTFAMSANTNVNVASGATLQLATNSSNLITSAAGLTLSGFGTSYSDGALQSVGIGNYAGAITLAGDSGISSTVGSTFTLGGNITGSGRSLTVGGEGAVTFNGSIATGTGGFTKLGSGVATLSGSNSFSGLTRVNEGVLALNNTNALAGGGDITFDGGTLRHTANNTLNLGSRIVNSSGPISIDTNSQTVNYSGIGASNTGGLTKLGAGRMTLSGNNSFSGVIAVNGGLLVVSSTSALPSVGTGGIFLDRNGALNTGGAYANVQGWLDSGNIATNSTGVIALAGNTAEAIDLTNYAGLSLGASTTTTYSGVITPAGSLYRLGGGGSILTLSGNNALTGTNGLVVSGNTVTLLGSNNMTGATTVASAGLALSGSLGSLANSAITVSPGASLTFGTSNSATAVTRASSVTLNRGTLLTSGTTTTNITQAITNGLTIGAGGNSVVTITGNASRNVLLTADSLSREAGGTALIRGTNLGVNAFSSSNTTNIQLNNANLVGSGTGLTERGIIVGVVGDTSPSGTGYGATGGLLTYDATNGVRLLSSSEYKTSIGDGQTTYDNILLSSTGALTTTLTGSTNVNSLSLRTGTSTANVQINGAGTLLVNSGVIYAASTAGAIGISNNLNFNGREAIVLSSFSSGALQLTGSLGNTGGNGLTIAGSGTVTLGGTLSNGYTGTTTVNGATLSFNKTAGLNAITGDLLVNTGGRVVYGTNNQISDASDITINGGAFVSTGTETVDNVAVSNSGTFSVSDFTVGGNLSISSGASMENAVATSGTVNGTTNLSDGGSITVRRSQSILGAYDSTVSLGALNITNSTTGAYTAISLDTGSGLAQSGGKLILNGDLTFTGNSTNYNTVLIDAVKGSGRQGVIELTGTRAFNIGDGAAKVDLRVTAGLVNGAGASGLTKTGAGTLELTGANTYTGATTVTAGTLLLNGTSVSAVTVNGGIFGGNGATSGALTVNAGGVLAPGSSIATLGSGAVTLNTSSTFAAEVDSSAALSVGADLLVASGGLSLNGTVTLTLTDLAAAPTVFAPGTTFTLVNYTGSWNGGLFTVGGNAIADGGSFTVGLNTWEIDYNASSGGSNFSGEYVPGNFVNITIVPEPTSAALVALSLTTVAFFRRRRK